MQWPEGIPSSSFETEARLKRYRLLANASIRTGVTRLFLGHHQDDQIETILMRLIRGQKGSLACFQGMTDHLPIPHCEDIFFNDISEGRRSINDFLQLHTDKFRSSTKPRRFRKDFRKARYESFSIKNLDDNIYVAGRLGITLYHPLLDFSKERILSTCEANDIPYVSDPTNFDPKLTLRNAVRHLISNYKLPRAISKENILRMHRKSKERVEVIKDECNAFSKAARLVSLNLWSGALVIRLPKYLHLLEWQDPKTPASYLSRLFQVISPAHPEDKTTFTSQATAVSLFPVLADMSSENPKATPSKTFTADQVLLTRVEPGAKDQDSEITTTWRLSRQPFDLHHYLSATHSFTHDSTADDGLGLTFRSQWLFWDHRYWIQIRCSSISYLQSCIIRPYRISDSENLRTHLERHSKRSLLLFEALLAEVAPGKDRYTLPVIADAEGIRAFPTLNFSIPVLAPAWKGLNAGRTSIGLQSWDVIYKHVPVRIFKSLGAAAANSEHREAAMEYQKSLAESGKAAASAVSGDAVY